MSRRLDISVPAELCGRIVQTAQDVPGVTSISVQIGASVRPPGDVVCIEATNEAALVVLEQLDGMNALESGSVTIAEPTGILAPSHLRELESQGSEAAWEEIGAQLRRGTNVTPDFLLLMAISGAVAAFGLVADTIHVVIGAMLVAPGFEPLLRVPYGALGRRRQVRPGLRSAAAGYAALAAGAAAALIPALSVQGVPAAGLPDLHWVRYWTDVTASGVVLALLAGAAGAIIVAARLTVFATGVMVVLALVPSMSLVGAGLAAGQPAVAAGGLLRWAADATCVIASGALVLGIKRWVRHRRRVYD